MRILFPIGSFYPSHEGGPSSSVYLLAKELSKIEGYFVTVITTDKGIDKSDLNFNEWIYCDDNFRVNYILRDWYFPLVWLKLLWIEIKSCDLVHLTSVFYPPSVIAATISMLLGKKVVWSVRGELNREALSFGYRKKMLLRPLLMLLSRNRKMVLHATSTKEQQEIASSFMRMKTVLIPNGINTSDSEVKSEMPKIILYLGRLHPIKAIDNALKAFASSSLPSKNFKFLIVGKGRQSYTDYLAEVIEENKIQGSVEFMGHLVGEKKDEIIMNSGWLILPSYSENFGNVVVESLRHSTPVIASTQTPWEDLAHYRAGLYLPNTVQDLTIAFNTIGGLDNNEYYKYSLNALTLISEKYQMSVIIDKWKLTYEES